MDITTEKHWYILASDPQVSHLFKDLPLFAQKWAPVWVTGWLKQTVVGTWKNFSAYPQSGCKFPLKSTISCNSKFVVDLLKGSCGLWYETKTKGDKTGVYEQKSSIRNHDESWVWDASMLPDLMYVHLGFRGLRKLNLWDVVETGRDCYSRGRRGTLYTPESLERLRPHLPQVVYLY